MENQIMAQTYKITFTCPKCKEGEMNCMGGDGLLLFSFGKVDLNDPQYKSKQLAHRCGRCGFIMGLPINYPYLMIEPIADLGSMKVEGTS